ncbi:hypothetical protein AVEN_268545-1 [Araneus ventricosus]|uniref:Uncharacterized protein n=1 Tax=Araneus ventricosus TaxID=182803 RepID=A0A4Y2MPQ6_ARAVE|nr:hypothetical protein AVEN_268545-1 [Araneus ventricosus]
MFYRDSYWMPANDPPPPFADKIKVFEYQRIIVISLSSMRRHTLSEMISLRVDQLDAEHYCWCCYGDLLSACASAVLFVLPVHRVFWNIR